VPLFAWLAGKAMGIHPGFAQVCSPRAGPEHRKPWFVLGLPPGAALLAGQLG
jgi:hypothetical protein